MFDDGEEQRPTLSHGLHSAFNAVQQEVSGAAAVRLDVDNANTAASSSTPNATAGPSTAVLPSYDAQQPASLELVPTSHLASLYHSVNGLDLCSFTLSSSSDSSRAEPPDAGFHPLDADTLFAYGIPSTAAAECALKAPTSEYNEGVRVAALKLYGDVTSLDDSDALQAITQLAANISCMPSTGITLVHADGVFRCATTPRGEPVHLRRIETFCSQVIRHPKQMTVVSDCQQDDRFRHHPLVTGPPFVRSYLGIPLLHDESQQAIGALCATDVQVRIWTDLQLASLQLLARTTTTLLLNRRRLLQIESSKAALLESNHVAQQAVSSASEAMRVKSNFLLVPFCRHKIGMCATCLQFTRLIVLCHAVMFCLVDPACPTRFAHQW